MATRVRFLLLNIKQSTFHKIGSITLIRQVHLFPEIAIYNNLLGGLSGFIQASMSKIQGLFKDLKLMKNTDLCVKILLQKY